MISAKWTLCLAAILVSVARPVAQQGVGRWPDRPISFLDLSYPREAQAARLQGFVVLELDLNAEGKVQATRSLHGDPRLSAAASSSAREWTYPSGAGKQVVVYRFDIDDGVCNDDQHSLFRLRYGALATVTACSKPTPMWNPATWPDDDLLVRRRPQTSYPPISQSARIQGLVVVRVSIAADGRVTDATTLAGVPLLIEAAVSNAKAWVFEPTARREAILVYEFALERISTDCSVVTYESVVFPRYIKVAASSPCINY